VRQVLFYSFLLILGIVCSQAFELVSVRYLLHTATMICLAYIMIEVGLAGITIEPAGRGGRVISPPFRSESFW